MFMTKSKYNCIFGRLQSHSYWFLIMDFIKPKRKTATHLFYSSGPLSFHQQEQERVLTRLMDYCLMEWRIDAIGEALRTYVNKHPRLSSKGQKEITELHFLRSFQSLLSFSTYRHQSTVDVSMLRFRHFLFLFLLRCCYGYVV